MEELKTYSKKSFWIITIFAMFLATCLNICIYQGGNWLKVNRLLDNIQEYALIKKILGFMGNVQLTANNFNSWFLPGVLCLFLILGWILWFILKKSTEKIFTKGKNNFEDTKNQSTVKKDFLDQKIEQERKRRLFLYSLSVLQRDGRLLDFFDENLSLYDDEQIGASVRSIQEDCKKTIKKYINLQPVLDREEGDIIKVEADFDMDSINLIGNITGEPPFEGVLKHRGWKAGKKEIPKLSDIQDSTIIIPAEVEIQ